MNSKYVRIYIRNNSINTDKRYAYFPTGIHHTSIPDCSSGIPVWYFRLFLHSGKSGIVNGIPVYQPLETLQWYPNYTCIFLCVRLVSMMHAVDCVIEVRLEGGAQQLPRLHPLLPQQLHFRVQTYMCAVQYLFIWFWVV